MYRKLLKETKNKTKIHLMIYKASKANLMAVYICNKVLIRRNHPSQKPKLEEILELKI